MEHGSIDTCMDGVHTNPTFYVAIEVIGLPFINRRHKDVVPQLLGEVLGPIASMTRWVNWGSKRAQPLILGSPFILSMVQQCYKRHCRLRV